MAESFCRSSFNLFISPYNLATYYPLANNSRYNCASKLESYVAKDSRGEIEDVLSKGPVRPMDGAASLRTLIERYRPRFYSLNK